MMDLSPSLGLFLTLIPTMMIGYVATCATASSARSREHLFASRHYR